MIIKLNDYFKDSEHFYFQLEYAAQNDLKTYLRQKYNIL